VAGSGDNWFVATVNGGVWKTTNLGDEVPSWRPVLDGQPVRCSSISSIAVFGEGMVLAGCGGSTSSEMGLDWNVVNSGEGRLDILMVPVISIGPHLNLQIIRFRIFSLVLPPCSPLHCPLLAWPYHTWSHTSVANYACCSQVTGVAS